MPPTAELIRAYAADHRHPVNRAIHLACVPLILVATVGIAWGVHLPRATMANLAWPLALAMLWGYSRLGGPALASGAAWIAMALAICAILGAAGVPLVPTSLVVWGLAWVAQFIGHAIEGVKPSFAGNPVFLLVGPLFVQEEILHRGRRSA